MITGTFCFLYRYCCTWHYTGVAPTYLAIRDPCPFVHGLLLFIIFLVRLLFFHCMPAGHHPDSTPDSRQACSSVLTITTVRAVRTVQTAPQTATAVVCSRELVSRGNGGTMLYN